MAKLYVQGIGVDPDQVTGAAWYILARRAGLTDPEMDDVMNGLTRRRDQAGDRKGQPPALSVRRATPTPRPKPVHLLPFPMFCGLGGAEIA